ncbi:hypothetical protein HDU97_006781 [Phlyctochytrium planicorne]|nr:hypothetical protein HDU97_006781 [Phlyctochytrium planicorne]
MLKRRNVLKKTGSLPANMDEDLQQQQQQQQQPLSTSSTSLSSSTSSSSNPSMKMMQEPEKTSTGFLGWAKKAPSRSMTSITSIPYQSNDPDMPPPPPQGVTKSASMSMVEEPAEGKQQQQQRRGWMLGTTRSTSGTIGKSSGGDVSRMVTVKMPDEENAGVNRMVTVKMPDFPQDEQSSIVSSPSTMMTSRTSQSSLRSLPPEFQQQQQQQDNVGRMVTVKMPSEIHGGGAGGGMVAVKMPDMPPPPPPLSPLPPSTTQATSLQHHQQSTMQTGGMISVKMPSEEPPSTFLQSIPPPPRPPSSTSLNRPLSLTDIQPQPTSPTTGSIGLLSDRTRRIRKKDSTTTLPSTPPQEPSLARSRKTVRIANEDDEVSHPDPEFVITPPSSVVVDDEEPNVSRRSTGASVRRKNTDSSLAPMGRRDTNNSLAPVGRRDTNNSLSPVSRRGTDSSLSPIGRRGTDSSLSPLSRHPTLTIASKPLRTTTLRRTSTKQRLARRPTLSSGATVIDNDTDLLEAILSGLPILPPTEASERNLRRLTTVGRRATVGRKGTVDGRMGRRGTGVRERSRSGSRSMSPLPPSEAGSPGATSGEVMRRRTKRSSMAATAKRQSAFLELPGGLSTTAEEGSIVASEDGIDMTFVRDEEDEEFFDVDDKWEDVEPLAKPLTRFGTFQRRPTTMRRRTMRRTPTQVSAASSRGTSPSRYGQHLSPNLQAEELVQFDDDGEDLVLDVEGMKGFVGREMGSLRRGSMMRGVTKSSFGMRRRSTLLSRRSTGLSWASSEGGRERVEVVEVVDVQLGENDEEDDDDLIFEDADSGDWEDVPTTDGPSAARKRFQSAVKKAVGGVHVSRSFYEVLASRAGEMVSHAGSVTQALATPATFIAGPAVGGLFSTGGAAAVMAGKAAVKKFGRKETRTRVAQAHAALSQFTAAKMVEAMTNRIAGEDAKDSTSINAIKQGITATLEGGYVAGTVSLVAAGLAASIPIDEATRKKMLANSYIAAATEALSHLSNVAPILPKSVQNLADAAGSIATVGQGAIVVGADNEDEDDEKEIREFVMSDNEEEDVDGDEHEHED